MKGATMQATAVAGPAPAVPQYLAPHGGVTPAHRHPAGDTHPHLMYNVLYIGEQRSTHEGHESAVIIALDEYESLMETVYLMQSPANARHLRDSIARHRAGEGVVHDLIELDED